MEGKRLGLLHELVPKSALIGVLLNPTNAPFESQLKDVEEAARALGREIHILQASKTQDIHVAFKAFVQMRVQGLLIGGDPFFNGRREQLVTLADHYAIPAIYELRDAVQGGRAKDYGTKLTQHY